MSTSPTGMRIEPSLRENARVSPKPIPGFSASALRDARVAAGLSVAELAARIDKPARTLARWERGERNPLVGTVATLAEALGVEPAQLLDAPAATGVRALADLRFACGLSQAEAAAELGVSRVRYTQIETGKGRPTLDQARKLAGLYRVSLDEIIQTLGELE